MRPPPPPTPQPGWQPVSCRPGGASLGVSGAECGHVSLPLHLILSTLDPQLPSLCDCVSFSMESPAPRTLLGCGQSSFNLCRVNGSHLGENGLEMLENRKAVAKSVKLLCVCSLPGVSGDGWVSDTRSSVNTHPWRLRETQSSAFCVGRLQPDQG